ncbi:MAG: pyridoxamine 5'-phosphate oxidase family protein [Rickettsiales bacterium]|jgi:general stress protein 26|nr:pyridoxamine 5'-phosphate oxidase family protein [Rickettsiales bacterium]
MNDEIKKSMTDIIKSCDSLHLCTINLDGYPETRHVMNDMNKETSGFDLHFLTNIKSPKYRQILKNPRCCLYYFNPENRHAIRLFGTIIIVGDQDQKKKYWRDKYESFGYSGANDENYALLQFVPEAYKFYAGNELQTGGL